eukprot:COSAG01_NODE_24849_length_764_cov_0.996992_1_plen_76_part_00
MHVAAINLPAEHHDTPDTVYPWRQVGWHMLPDDSHVILQEPLAPFTGAVLTLHGFGLHVAAVSVPNLHEDMPETL